MDKLEKNVDFDSVNKNIDKEGLDINLIRVIYKGLTEGELIELSLKQETVDLEEGKVLAKYPSDLNPLYKNKAVGILYLGA